MQPRTVLCFALTLVLALSTASVHAWQSHESRAVENGMKLILAGKFTVVVPESVSVIRSGPSSVGPYESYALGGGAGLPGIDIFIAPYQVSSGDVPSKCTVSVAFDRGDRNGPLFCEGAELSRSLSTRLGPAKWKHIISPNSTTMNSPPLPASEAYVHEYVVVVPIKSDGLMLEFWAAADGDKEEPRSRAGKELWPMIRDKILPSLDRVSECRSQGRE